MDPLTQGLLGAAAVQVSRVPRKSFRIATLVGALGGMASDLDVLIASDKNPLLGFEFHRHFTHSLAFIPIGGPLMGLILWGILAKGFRKALSLKESILWATIGFATHGLLDAFTSYGTQLFWPFSSTRIAWALVAAVDPIFTGALLLGVIFSVLNRRGVAASLGLLAVSLYLILGSVQSSRARNILETLISERGHVAKRVVLHPTLFNNVVWRGLYLTDDDKIYVQGLYVGWFGSTAIFDGGSLARLDRKRDYPELANGSQQAKDIDLFSWFSDGFVAAAKERDYGDVRYAILPNGLGPLWGIRVNPSTPDSHVEVWHDHGFTKDDLETFRKMILGDPWAAQPHAASSTRP